MSKSARMFRFYHTAARMSARANLQYRGQHMINNIGSAVFGFIFIAIWRSVASGGVTHNGYDAATLTQYIVLCQCLMWITLFDQSGIQLARRVRDGSIGADLLRPVGFMGLQLAGMYGKRLYNFVFRSLTLAGIFWLTVGLLPPASANLWLLVPGWLLAMHSGIIITYLIGLVGFWTVEANWMYLAAQSLTFMLGGASIPLDFMPAALRSVALASPFPCLAYYPATLYLGTGGVRELISLALWAVGLTALAALLTWRARRRAEVVGG